MSPGPSDHFIAAIPEKGFRTIAPVSDNAVRRRDDNRLGRFAQKQLIVLGFHRVPSGRGCSPAIPAAIMQ